MINSTSASSEHRREEQRLRHRDRDFRDTNDVTPGVTILQDSATYPDMIIDASGANSPAFQDPDVKLVQLRHCHQFQPESHLRQRDQIDPDQRSTARVVCQIDSAQHDHNK